MTDVQIFYFRVHELDYPRNERIRGALAERGHVVRTHVRSRAGHGVRFLRDLVDLVTGTRGVDAIVVAENSLEFAAPARVVGALRGVPVVVDAFVGKYETRVVDRGDVPRRSVRARAFALVDAVAARSATVTLTDTRVRRDAALAARPGDRVVSVPVGAPGWVVAVPRIPAPRLRVLFYGSYLPLHGALTIVEALARAHDQRIDLTMIGTTGTDHPGGVDDARALGELLGVADRITFLPSTSPEGLSDAVAAHDVVLGLFGGSEKAASVIANKVWQGLAGDRVVVTRESPALAELRPIVGDQLIEVPPADPVALGRVLAHLVDDLPGPFSGRRAVLEGYVEAEIDLLDDALRGAVRSSRRGRRSARRRAG